MGSSFVASGSTTVLYFFVDKLPLDKSEQKCLHRLGASDLWYETLRCRRNGVASNALETHPALIAVAQRRSAERINVLHLGCFGLWALESNQTLNQTVSKQPR